MSKVTDSGPNSGRNLTKSGRHRANSSESKPKAAEIGPNLANIAQSWSKPSLAKTGRTSGNRPKCNGPRSHRNALQRSIGENPTKHTQVLMCTGANPQRRPPQRRTTLKEKKDAFTFRGRPRGSSNGPCGRTSNAPARPWPTRDPVSKIFGEIEGCAFGRRGPCGSGPGECPKVVAAEVVARCCLGSPCIAFESALSAWRQEANLAMAPPGRLGP